MCVRLRLSQFNVFSFFMLFVMGGLQAHEVRPAVLTMDVQADATFHVSVDLNLEAFLSGLTAKQGEQHADTDAEGQTDAVVVEYERLRALAPDALERLLIEQQTTLLKALRIRSAGKCVRLRLDAIAIPDVSVLPVARNAVITLTGQLPDSNKTFSWSVSQAFGDVILRVNAGEQAVHTDYLQAGTRSAPVTVP